jgi:regulator of replication initiation timing
MEGFGQPLPDNATQPEVLHEIKALRLKLQQLAVENNSLKNENRVLKERLGQIKKLAA